MSRTTRSPVRRTLFFFAFAFSLPVLLVGCPKKKPPVPDAEAPPPATSASVTELAPLVDDAGDDGDAAEAGKKWSGGGGGGGGNAKVLRCCAALRTQAKKVGASSPEGFQLNALAGQCEVAAKGNAPEFGQLFAILKSKNVPECQALP